MQEASSQQVTWSMADGERGDARTRLSLVASMVLLGVSFLLLIAAPVVADRMHLLATRALPADALHRWIPTAAGAGLALGGGSALVFVLSRLVRDMERRPYACLAPALGVFCGALLMGLRAKLPLPGIASEHVAVFALALAVLGGAFVQERPLVHRLLGLSLTLFPILTLVLAVWGLSQHTQLGAALWSLPSAARVYLVLLGVSSSAMAILGLATGGAHPASSTQALQSAEGPYGAAAPSMLVDARVLAREDTLELSLREDERLLRRRFVPGWVLVMVPVAVLLGVALSAFQSQRSHDADRAHDLPERKLVTAQDPRALQAESDAPTIESLAGPGSAEGSPNTPRAEPTGQAAAANGASAQAVTAAAERAGAAITLPASVLEVPRQAATSRASHRRAAALLDPPSDTAGAKAAIVASGAPAASEEVAARGEAEGIAAHVEADRVKTLPTSAQPGAEAAPRTSAKGLKHKSKASPKRRVVAAPKKPVSEAAAPTFAAEARAEPVKATPAVKATPVPAPQDDSLDALMDRAVDAVKGQKGRQNVEDDPIFGL